MKPLHRPSVLWATSAILVLCICCPDSQRACADIRIATYNILNYDGVGACDVDRETLFRTVLNDIQADIVCVQEVVNQTTGVNNFFNDVLNHVNGPGGYSAAPFINGQGGGGDNAMYYRGAAIEYISGQTIPTAGFGGIRDWTYYKVRQVGITGPEGELHIFIAHLSSGGGAAQRAIEADVYRDWAELNLPDGAHVLCLGDFNLESSAEVAWTRFTETRPSNRGRVRDPANRVGNWSSSSFADVSTQAPQTSEGANCSAYSCGYSGGGMDDRFDFILTSDPLHDGLGLDYIAGTYQAFGNDGLHWNKSINDSPPIPEGATMASALTCASDHLPVILDLQDAVAAPIIGPTPPPLTVFPTVIVDGVSEKLVTITNEAAPPAEDLDYNMSASAGFTAPAGFFAAAAGVSNDHTLSMDTSVSAGNSGTLVVFNDSANDPVYQVTLVGTVKDHAIPSTQASGQVATTSLDFGEHDVGQFADQTASVHNADFVTFLSADLEVYDATITNDAQGRFSLTDFLPTTGIQATPADFNVHFDDTSASPATYTATLDFSTRDEQALSGAINLSNITFNLTATVTSSGLVLGDLSGGGTEVVDMADLPLFVALLLDPGGATPQDQVIADMNIDLSNDSKDIQLFVDALVP